MRKVLLHGGPADARIIEVPDNLSVFRVPKPVDRSLWLSATPSHLGPDIIDYDLLQMWVPWDGEPVTWWVGIANGGDRWDRIFLTNLATVMTRLHDCLLRW